MNYITTQFMNIKECIEIVKIVFEKNQIYCVNRCYKRIVTTGYSVERVLKDMQNLTKSFQAFGEVQ